MTHVQIPCEVYARLAAVALAPRGPTIHNEWFKSIRLDGNCAVACNGPILAVERLDTIAAAPVHVVITDALIEQCRKEAGFKSSLFVSSNPALQFASAKTTMGYSYPGNACIWSKQENKLDKWRSVVPTKLPTKSKGGMFMNAELIAILGASSPSGRIVFAEHIERGTPTLIRDTYDDRWFGMWNPSGCDGDPEFDAATVPGWFK